MHFLRLPAELSADPTDRKIVRRSGFDGLAIGIQDTTAVGPPFVQSCFYRRHAVECQGIYYDVFLSLVY